MMMLLALLGLAYAGNDESKCALNFLNGETDDYGECGMDSEIDSLISQSQQCWSALGKCQGGGGGGGAIAPMGLLVKYGDKQFGFGLTQKFPLGACFDEIHRRALVNFGMDDDHELVFDYANANPKITGKIRDDGDLETALLTAQRMDFFLTITAQKTTLAPTPEPTEPWGTNRYVRQVYGNIADGRDSGLPGVDAKTQRKLSFKKQSADTSLRLHYEDNFRVYNHGGVCYWELYIDGKRCKGTGNTGIIRGAMHSHGHENNDHQTASVIGITREEPNNLYAAGEHEFRVQLSGNGRDCYTGWDPESKGTWMLEVKEVKRGEYSYLAWKQSYGPVRGEDNAFPILGRELKFTKDADSTTLRLLWYDNFRVYNGGHCRWYLRVDNAVCEGNKFIASSIHTHGNENDHVPQTIVGYCNGIKAGEHTLKGGVQSGGHDCYTGWENNMLLEVRELTTETLGGSFDAKKDIGSGIYYFMKSGSGIADGRDNGYITGRVLKFDKQIDDSLLRLTYGDNLRVHGHGKWCKWEIRVDEKSCKQPLTGSRYVVKNQNDHTPGVIIGYCDGIKAGRHEMKVTVKGNSADCYTGWDRQTQGSFLLESEEVKKDVILPGGTGSFDNK